MGCCNSDNQTESQRGRRERDLPDDVESCCNIRGERCMCLPYDDPFVITAMILTIVAFFFSWVWWFTWLISSIGMGVFQVFWCARMGTGGVYAQAAVAGLTSLASLAVAIYVLVAWRKKRYCDPYFWWTSDDDYVYEDDVYMNSDRCREKTWFAISLVCGLLWAACAACMVWFAKSGNHAKWEQKHTPVTATVELAAASPNSVVIPEGGESVVAHVLQAGKEDSV